MSKCITRWSPDTCGCIVEFEWDNEIPVEQRTHKHYATLTQCAFHKNMPSEGMYDVLMGENLRKNDTVNKLKELQPDYDISQGWYFDDKRKLIVKDTKGVLTPKQKKKVQNEVTLLHGEGKVEIV